MATATLQHPDTRESSSPWREAPPATGPLLVATDGSVASDAALRAARAISSETGQSVTLLAVHAPLPMMGPEVLIAPTPSIDAEQRAALQMQLEEQLERVGVSEPWPEQVVTGYPAATIANVAKNIDASLIVMGLGGHDLFERIFGDEMVLQVLRIGTVPVLAVAADFTELPSRALAAIDFSPSSGRALALGGRIIKAGGRVMLAHVAPVDRDPVSWTSLDSATVGSVERALDRMVADAGVAEAVLCERHVLAGDPSKQLLKLAVDLQPDLIIAGSHGRNFLSRLLLGSVSTRLLRQSGCSMLIAPPVEGPEVLHEMAEERGRFAFYEWTERLEEFTRRNAGKLARLEVIDPEIGAQIEENHAPFVGASFDPRDGRVHIMFGGRDGGGHLTRSIGGVTAVQMLRDRAGRDVFLRVAHGRGQTLLTLER